MSMLSCNFDSQKKKKKKKTVLNKYSLRPRGTA